MASRRANGEGSISRRKDGRWEGALYVRTVSGVRKRIRFYGSTRREVSEKLATEVDKANRGVATPDRTWLLADYLDHWLETIVKIGRSPATYAQCEMISRLYLQPGLGTIALAQLTPARIQAFVNRLIGAGHSIPKVRIIRKVLSSALTAAFREDLVARNAARAIVLPRYEAPEVFPWSADEATTFLRAARHQSFYPAFVLLLLYGMRRGEVLGLRWQDVDFDTGVIRIRQQVQRVGRQILTGPLKTKASRRTLPLVPVARDALLAHRAIHLAEWRAGRSWESPATGALVFATKTGRATEPSNLVRAFHRTRRTAGVRRIKVHDARHTTATLLKDLGVPVRDAQLILGHAKASTTQEIYEHDNLLTRQIALGKVEHVFVRAVREDKRRSRQISRQTELLAVAKVHSTSGAGEGTLTPGLVLGKSIHPTVPTTLTEVKLLARARYQLMLLGAAAVICSRQQADDI